MAVECIHSRPSGRASAVRCVLGLFGGRPHISSCNKCSQKVLPQITRVTNQLSVENGKAIDPSRIGLPIQPNDILTDDDGLFQSAPRSDYVDQQDDQQSRWGQERHEGFFVGRYLQAPPLLFTADHHPIWLGDFYRGRSAFLICGGPSFGNIPYAMLRQPGILTMALNNSVKTFRPNLWVSVDSPDHFLRSIWLDPAILKFVPICHAQKRLFDSDAWKWMETTVRDCPSVLYFKRNEHFQPSQFLWEDTFNWGNHKSHGGGRSVMLPALRLLFYLGIRRVFLLGADFNMDTVTKYHFEQERSRGSINGNNSTFQRLNEWFAQLRPLFEKEQFKVFNCNFESRLRAFQFVTFEAAIEMAMSEWGRIDVRTERSSGLYDLNKGAQ